MKKWLCIFISIVILGAVNGYSTYGEIGSMSFSDITFGEEVDYGEVLFRTSLVRGTTTVQDGRPVVVANIIGIPSRLQVVDLNTGELLTNILIPNGPTHTYEMETLSNGDVVFGTNRLGGLYIYSPETKTIKQLASIGTGTCLSLSVDENEEYAYLGMYPSAAIQKYDLKTGQVTLVADTNEKDQYVYAAYYKNTLYYRNPYDTYNGIKKLDIATGEETLIPYKENTLKANTHIRVVDNYLVLPQGTSVNDKTSLMTYNIDTGEWGAMVEGVYPSTQVSGNADGWIYFSKDGYAHGLNLETHEVKKTNIPSGTYQRGSQKDFVELDDPDMPGLNYVNLTYSGGISIWNFQTDKAKVITDAFQGTASQAHTLCFEPNGKLIVGEFQGVQAAELDLKTGEIALMHMAQPEGICAYGDKVYFGTYSQARLYILDTKKPYYKTNTPDDPENNPRIWGSIENDQDRPFCLIPAGDKIAIGSIPYYGVLGGALSIYDPDTDEMDIHRFTDDLAPISMAYYDNKLYIGCSVSGGLGSFPTQNRTKIKVFDMDKREFINEAVLEIPGFDENILGVEGMSIAPDGSIVGAGRAGYLFKMDRETLKLTGYKTFDGASYGQGQQLWSHINMNYDPVSGYIFLSNFMGESGSLKIVDWRTLEYADTGLKTVYNAVMGSDNNLYYIKNNRVTMLPIIRKGDYSYKLASKVIIKEGRSEAVFDGALQDIDNNSGVAPYVENGRMMVPINFMAKCFDLKIAWNDYENYALVYNDKIAVEIYPEKLFVRANGNNVRINAPAVEKEGRLFLHVRAFADLFEKELYWDSNSGLVVMNLNGTAFDPARESDVIKYAQEYFDDRMEDYR